MAVLSDINQYSFKLFEKAVPTALTEYAYSRQGGDYVGADFFKSVKTRMCFLAQFIVSLVALPVILLVGLVTAAVKAISREDGVQPLKDMLEALKNHVAVVIPTSFVGVIAPLTWSGSLAKNLSDCAVMDIRR